MDMLLKDRDAHYFPICIVFMENIAVMKKSIPIFWRIYTTLSPPGTKVVSGVVFLPVCWLFI